ncbi:RNA methyltransferase, TrmH family [Caldanaerobius fijiensis DSM 17918]|uniref:RNA methyltransferase, TrmH family n=1 Tax=Caldanaerobius fijiensis DSM 17918 TaxID=1121256 RepID=A0A1M4XGW2_9THEO|nr:RNA methyltransferase [Caldanaerobius fijiensis]SHE92794.1 RNA methyltransferase, TrmH family [Caldanaerobius fijiensis DSM 17918]
MVITSLDNPVVKLTMSLKQKKYRQQLKKYTIEGIKLVEEALKSNAPVEYILTVDEKTYYSGIKTYVVSEKVLSKLSEVESPQGIMAVVNMEEHGLNDIIKGENNLIVVLDGLQDPGNIGTIIRTADAMGVSGIIAVKGTGDIYNSKAIRASMGSIFHIPVVYIDDLLSAYDFLKKRGIRVIATSLNGDMYPYDINFMNSAVVFGNEGNGISSISESQADHLVKIPMVGLAESLNVAASAAVILYEALRQRKKGGLCGERKA